jgi:hypothetical protein
MCLKEIEIRATKKTLRHVLKVIILVFAWMPKASQSNEIPSCRGRYPRLDRLM